MYRRRPNGRRSDGVRRKVGQVVVGEKAWMVVRHRAQTCLEFQSKIAAQKKDSHCDRLKLKIETLKKKQFYVTLSPSDFVTSENIKVFVTCDFKLCGKNM